MERHAILTEELVRGLISELEAVKFKEDLTRENTYAYVYPESGDKTVYLCPLFWKASTDLGEESQPGTLIHEASHFLGIHDITYSKESIYVACRGKLAKLKVDSDPSAPDLNPLGKAVLNANNITYEFEITLNHKGRYKNGRYSCCGEKAMNSVCERAVPEEFLIHHFRESLSIIKDIDEILMESLLPARERVKRHLEELLEIADAIDKIHKGATIANITGGTVGIAGGITTIVGLALIPVTFGASLIVSLTGLAVSTAGGLTSAAATTTDIVASKVKRETVETVLKDCQIEVDQMKNYAERIEEKIQCLRENENSGCVFAIPQIGSGAGRSVLNTIKMVKAGQLLANVGRIAKFAGAATHVLTALTLGLDIFFVAKDSVELHRGAKTELAAKIREIVHDIKQMIGENNRTCTTLTADKQK
ncbi:apolipoprotein L6-like [Macrochelys suwanniensis]